jgi:hypothetical protein
MFTEIRKVIDLSHRTITKKTRIYLPRRLQCQIPHSVFYSELSWCGLQVS